MQQRYNAKVSHTPIQPQVRESLVISQPGPRAGGETERTPVAILRRCPRSRSNWRASGPSIPDVSTATRTKWWLASQCAYLALLACSACCATAPEDITTLGRCERENVYGLVAFQTKTFPSFQGTKEMSSGRFPSDRYMSEGSR